MNTIETTDKDDAAKIAQYGITTSSVTFYHYGRYRYTTLEAAVAEAERDKTRP